MKRTVATIAMLMVFTVFAPAQTSAPQSAPAVKPADPNREMMKKLDFLVGDWEGEGWMSIRGQKSTFTSNEKVQSKLDGSIIMIEGLHKSKPAAGEQPRVVHNALAVISYDDRTAGYRFHSYLAGGSAGDFEGKVEDGAFVWTLAFPGVKIRYRIALNGKGEWHEVGETSTDGAIWNKTFEMTLHKVGR